jgi:hypothetical protein
MSDGYVLEYTVVLDVGAFHDIYILYLHTATMLQETGNDR